MSAGQMNGGREQSQRVRLHLAQLCRGYLLLSDTDPSRAKAFLRTFLEDVEQAE